MLFEIMNNFYIYLSILMHLSLYFALFYRVAD